jgi:hypothetical protein
MRPRENGPTNEPNQHVEAGEPGKRCREARLTAEAPLDVLEKDDPVCRGLDIPHRRQQHRRQKCDAPDPQNDGEDVEGSGDRYIIHRARSYSPDHREV